LRGQEGAERKPQPSGEEHQKGADSPDAAKTGAHNRAQGT